MGSIDASVGAAGPPLIGLLFVFAITVATDDEAAAYVVALVSAFAAALCAVSAGVYSLDVLQLQNEVGSGLAGSTKSAQCGSWRQPTPIVSAWREAKAAAPRRL